MARSVGSRNRLRARRPSRTYAAADDRRGLTPSCTPAATRPSARPASPTRGRLSRPAKVWWHRDLAPAHTSRATHPEVVMRSLCHDLPTAQPGSAVTLEGWVHRRRELARVTFLVVRDRSGLAQVVLPAGTPVPPEETTVRVTGTATANAQAPGGVEVTEAAVEPLTEPAATPPAELWRPSLDVSLPTLLDNAPVLWRHPAQRARWELAAASLRGFRSTLDGLGFTEIARRSSSSRRPSPGRRSSPSTTSAGRPTSPRARSSTSSSWSGSSSGSTRSGRCSAPSRTTPCATSPSTARSTSSSASSTTTATCSRCCARCWRGWSASVEPSLAERGRRPTCRSCPRRSR